MVSVDANGRLAQKNSHGYAEVLSVGSFPQPQEDPKSRAPTLDLNTPMAQMKKPHGGSTFWIRLKAWIKVKGLDWTV